MSFSLVNYFYCILGSFVVGLAKNYILDLCQFFCLIFWGHSMKTLPHLELWKKIMNHLPGSYEFQQNKQKKQTPPHHPDWVFTVKFNIKCFPASWLSVTCLPCVHTYVSITGKALLNVSVHSCEYKHVQTSSVYIGPVFGGLPEDFTLFFVLSSYYSVLWIVWFCCR